MIYRIVPSEFEDLEQVMQNKRQNVRVSLIQKAYFRFGDLILTFCFRYLKFGMLILTENVVVWLSCFSSSGRSSSSISSLGEFASLTGVLLTRALRGRCGTQSDVPI